MADRYWVGGTGTWDNTATTHWSTSSGGSSGASAPTTSDNVIFDANSNTGTGNFTVTTGVGAACLDFSTGGAGGALDGTMTLTLSSGGLTVAGNLTFPATNFATSGTVTITFTATSAKTISTNGVNITADLAFNGVGGTWQLQGNTSSSRSLTLTNGTLDLNGFTLTAFSLASNNSNTRTIAFGTGKISLSATNNITVWNMATATGFSFTGTPNIELTAVGSTGTRTLNFGGTAGANETYALPFKILGGTDAFALTGSFGNIDFTGFAGTMGNAARTFYGNLTLGSGMAVTGGGNALTFAKTTGQQTLNTNGVTLNQPLILNGVGGGITLASNCSITASLLTLTNGTLDLAGFTFSAGTFLTAAGTKSITFNGGSLALSGSGATAFNNSSPTNFTTTAGAGVGSISLTSASAKTFVGGGSTFNCAINQGGAGALTITGSNTFSDITNTVNSTSVLFTAATTTTFTTGFHLSDTTIDSATAANHNLSMASGAVNVANDTISHSQAAGGATWNSYTTNGNVDNGNNSGWIFTPPVGYPRILVF